MRGRIVCAFVVLMVCTAGSPRTARGAGAFFDIVGLPVAENVGAEAAVDAIISDLNSDGMNDVFVAMGNAGTTAGSIGPAADRVYLAVSGVLQRVPVLLDDPPAAAAGVAIADFNRDGAPDIALAGGIDQPGGVVVPTRIHLRTSAAPLTYDAGQLLDTNSLAAVDIAAADWDIDGDTDLAIALTDGTVSLYLNESPTGGPLQIFRVGSITVATGPAGAIAFLPLHFASRPDLLALRPSGDASSPRGLLIFPNTLASVPFDNAPILRSLPGTAALVDLATGDVNGDGRIDVVVAARSAPGSTVGESRVFLGGSDINGPTLIPSPFQFPVAATLRAAVADLDGDALADIVFSHARCDALQCSGLTESNTISVWRSLGSSFAHTRQCLGRNNPATRALAIGRTAGSGVLPDVFAIGGQQTGSAPPPETAVNLLRNDAAGQTRLCCMAQFAAAYGELPMSAKPHSVRSALQVNAVASVEVEAFRRVRDELMAVAANGARLRARYQQFSPEIVTMMVTDSSLWSQAALTLNAWSRPVTDLADGNGSSSVVTNAMVSSVDQFLMRLSTLGSPALSAAIADERARLPPFSSFVGMNMNQFANVTLPVALFANGFEE
jgi:hypothetical protein